MYNKNHIDEITGLLWYDKLDEFQNEHPEFEDIYDWTDKQSLAKFLNKCITNGWKGHVFYTLAMLKYDSL